MKYVDIRVSALNDSDLRSFIQMLMYIHKLGMDGCSREFKVIVDGDGSGYYRFQYRNEKNGEWEEFPDSPLEITDNQKFYLGE